MNSIHVGKIVATFGVDGWVILKHSLGKKTNFKDVETIFIEITKAKPIPFFLIKAKSKTTEETYLNIEGILTKEKAHLLVGKQVWLTEEDFRKLAGKQSAIALLGYTIMENKKVIGIVNEVIEQPHQILLSTIIQDKEVYIPIHEDSLQKINHTKKEIEVQLPDGLLDVYLT